MNNKWYTYLCNKGHLSQCLPQPGGMTHISMDEFTDMKPKCIELPLSLKL